MNADAAPEDRLAAAREAFLAAVAHHEAGRLDAAEAGYQRALALCPGRPSVLLNLAQLQLTRGRAPQVPQTLAPLLAGPEPDGDALRLLLQAAEASGSAPEAITALQALCRRHPADAELQHRLGQWLGRAGRDAEALAAFDAALQRNPAHAGAWTQRGSLLREQGRLADAAHSFRQALAHGGDVELNGWFLAAVEGRVAAAPPRYVQALFDGYADDFEQHLVGTLGYRVPRDLVAMLDADGAAAPPGALGDALDLGCGTGLVARALGPRVRAIDGVDLAPRMVAAARATGLYRRVEEADAVAALRARAPASCDLVLAADVFIYVADLAPVFAGARRVLRPGGRLAFSVEVAQADEGVALGAQLRYRHGAGHVRALAAAHGFSVRAQSDTVLRQEQGRPIAGQLWLLG